MTGPTVGERALCAERMSRWVAERAEPGTAATVVSVYRRAANLCLDAGDWLAICAHEVPLAPNGIAVALPPGSDFLGLGLRPRGGAWLDRYALRVPGGGFRLEIAGVPRWEPRVRVGPMAVGALASALTVARPMVIAEAAPGSLAPLLWDSAPTTAIGARRRAAAGVAALRRAVAWDDGPGVTAGARRLAGLGPGLTPAGDDFLAGFAAAWAAVPVALGCERARGDRVLGALAAGAEGASRLGRSWLAHACRAEVAEPMGDFLRALGGPPARLAPAVRRVLGMGATSGADWLTGALIGLETIVGALDGEGTWS